MPTPTQTQEGPVVDQVSEWLLCSESPIYFIDNYCYIYDATTETIPGSTPSGTWIPFKLWRQQAFTLDAIKKHPLVIILKARQLGITWLVLAFALWLMLFRPSATVLIFSRRDTDAIYLLGEERLRGMYDRLPAWLRAERVLTGNDHEWILSNGSVARSFPTSAGDSYTASMVIIDEADLVPDLGKILNAVKPTIDGGGKLVLLSRSDNEHPESQFKKIYRAAKAGLNGWFPVFLPWWVRPNRSKQWYENQKKDILERTFSLDDLHQQYPASDVEALAARTLDKRIPPELLDKVYAEMKPLQTFPAGAPRLAGLQYFKFPERLRKYVIGADPAEGNPKSDGSSFTVIDDITGEEVASFDGKIEPGVFASYIDKLGTYYNMADVLVERNNHGHAVLLWLREHSKLKRISGEDKKPGWSTNATSKSFMYDKVVDSMNMGEVTIHAFETATQLGSIEASTLRAPEGLHDDRAMSASLAILARKLPRGGKLAYA